MAMDIKKAARLILSGNAAEILLKRARRGRLSFRVGEVLRVPKVQGCTTLLFDYDNCKRRPSIRGIRERLAGASVYLVQAKCSRSPSGKGWHVFAVVRGRWDRYQYIALTALCESDPERAAQEFTRAQIFGNKEFFARGSVFFKNQK